jgi:thiamine-monophosphate kinase
LYVSGTLGDARLGLACLGMRRGAKAQARQRRPMPRTRLGLFVRRFASACIDVSDGLAGDLEQMCRASGVGARVEVALLPISAELKGLVQDDAWRWALAGGEDYELLIAVPRRRANEIERACRRAGEPVTRIGELTRRDIFFAGPTGRRVPPPRGFEHFRA